MKSIEKQRCPALTEGVTLSGFRLRMKTVDGWSSGESSLQAGAEGATRNYPSPRISQAKGQSNSLFYTAMLSLRQWGLSVFQVQYQ